MHAPKTLTVGYLSKCAITERGERERERKKGAVSHMLEKEMEFVQETQREKGMQTVSLG